ncbi:hypothetical protein [Bifidobacterium cuniculi]|uniref:Uncharacterized protein n=1 Tax=Bifidobacterium cuniculi TaxID=1688 RepID=A0A087B0K6_9BIFI|nr:hypothetical protein [Bifidobacterium cuniculi]KFI64556.1 hypothetical protein BCUN_2009 [Bifidobacterium cuniculi]
MTALVCGRRILGHETADWGNARHVPTAVPRLSDIDDTPTLHGIPPVEAVPTDGGHAYRRIWAAMAAAVVAMALAVGVAVLLMVRLPAADDGALRVTSSVTAQRLRQAAARCDRLRDDLPAPARCIADGSTITIVQDGGPATDSGEAAALYWESLAELYDIDEFTVRYVQSGDVGVAMAG